MVTIPRQRDRGRRPAAVQHQQRRPGRPGGRVRGHRHPGAQPGPHGHQRVVDARPRRSRPTPITLSATVNNIGERASAATTVKFYLGTTLASAPRTSARSPAGGSQTRLVQHRHPRRRQLRRDRPRSTRPTRSSRRATTNNTGSAGSTLVVTAGAELGPGRRWSPARRATRRRATRSRSHVAIRNQGNVASASGAHGITLTLLNDQGGTVTHHDRLVHRHDQRRRDVEPRQPGHVDGRQRPLHGPGGARRRRQRAVGQAGQQHQRHRRSSSVAARTCRTTCTRPRTARSVAAPRCSARTAPSATSPVRRPAAGRSRCPARAPTCSGPPRRRPTRSSCGAPFRTTPVAPARLGTLNIYVNGTFHKKITLTSKYAWLYGAEASPQQLARLRRSAAHLRRGQRHAGPARSRPAA